MQSQNNKRQKQRKGENTANATQHKAEAKQSIIKPEAKQTKVEATTFQKQPDATQYNEKAIAKQHTQQLSKNKTKHNQS